LPDCPLHVLLAAATALSWLGLGTLVLAPLRAPGDRLLDALNRVLAGALAFGLLTLAAGLLGLVRTWLYMPVLAVAAVAGAVALRRLTAGAPPPRPRSWPGWQQALLAALAAQAVLALVVTCAPVSAQDALAYHAAAPALFERAGEIRELTWSPQAYQPFTVQMLVLNGALLWDAVQGAFAPLLLAFVAAAAVGAAGYRLGGRTGGLLAAAVFSLHPFMLWEAASLFVEPAVAAAVTVGAWNLGRWARRGEPGALVAAGLLAGGAAGMKYHGLVLALLLAAGGALAARRLPRPREALLFGLPALAVAAPWYVLNLVRTGDPLYPTFAGEPEAREATRAVLDSYGHGRSLEDALLLPLRLLGDAGPFDRGEFVTPLFLLFAPLALMAARERRAAVVAWAFTLAYVAFWFLTSQQARFLAPLMGVLALLAAAGIVGLARRGRAGRAAAAAITAGALAVGLSGSAVYAASFVPAGLGIEEEERFLLRTASYHDGVLWLNRELPPTATVLIETESLLYLELPHVGFTRYVLPTSSSPERVRSFVREHGITHVAVLAGSGGTAPQLEALDLRHLADVEVRGVTSRTLRRAYLPATMAVYEVRRG
jgi:hypothetical protein